MGLRPSPAWVYSYSLFPGGARPPPTGRPDGLSTKCQDPRGANKLGYGLLPSSNLSRTILNRERPSTSWEFLWNVAIGRWTFPVVVGRPFPGKNDRMGYFGILQKRSKLYKQGAGGSLTVDAQARQSHSLRHVYFVGFEAILNDIRRILNQNGVTGIRKPDLAVLLYKSCCVFLR